MNNIKTTFRLLLTNMKRLKHYILQIIISVMVLLSICSLAGYCISKKLYEEGTAAIVKVAYYLPEDEDEKFNNFGLRIIKELDGTKEVAQLIEVETLEEGYELLEKGEVLYYIIVPEMFFSGIMDSTNPELTVLFRDNTGIGSYISNELFLSYARYLGMAQSGVYSALDTLREYDYPASDISDAQGNVNMTFLDRSLNKDSYLEKADATEAGSFTLIQRYLASALMISLFFVSFVIMPYLQGINKGIRTKLNTLSTGHFHIFVANFLSCIPALYIAFVPCYVALSIICKTFNPLGLITILPAIFVISLTINIISSICQNEFTSNMTILAVTLITAYIGGGILPQAMLPNGIQEISSYIPGNYLITTIASAIFGA